VDVAASNEYRYWAFISYSSQDKAWADWLHRAIESYGIPARLMHHATPTGEGAPKRLRPVFRDRAELSASADLGREIEDALRASRFLIVICSPNAARSPWVNKEIETFQRFGRSGRVLAVIVDGEPHAGGDRECFPAALLQAEPIAADARKTGDGKDNARLKVLAGMLGIGFDALKQREAHRRIRRLQAGIALLSAIVLVVTGLAIYAEGQRVKAVKARQQAENLVGYMLFDLRDQLDTIGRLDIMQNTQNMVDDYYRELGDEAADASVARNRGVALSNKGNMLLAEGDREGALREFRAALAVSESLAASDPNNTLWQSDVSLDHSKVGALLEGNGDLAGALAEFQAAVEISTRAASMEPGLAVLRGELADRRSAVARVLETQGDLAGALEQYRAALAVDEGLVTSDPGNTQWQANASNGHADVGRLLDRRGDVAGALREFRTVLAMSEALASSDPSNFEWQGFTADAHVNVGSELEEQQDLAGALLEYRTAVKISKGIVSSDPRSARWRLVAVWGQLGAGRVLWEQRDVPAAVVEYRAAIDTARLVAASDPSDTTAAEDLYFAHFQFGDFRAGSGDTATARREYQSARDVVQKLLETDGSNTVWKGFLTDLDAAVAKLRTPH
jgi:tetratricopeptide (TPR) repeat protein